MEVVRITRGEEYSVPFYVTKDGAAMDMTDVERIEFYIGPRIRKVWPDEVTTNYYSHFYVPVTERETAALPLGRVKCEVWVHYTDGGHLSASHEDMLEVLPSRKGDPR